jgi:hypothetical protein
MTSGEGEYRELFVSGVMSPEKWEQLTQVLGGLGVYSETTYPLGSVEKEPVYDPALFSSKAEFLEFAHQDDNVHYPVALAGKAWARLEKLYLHKACPTYYWQNEPSYNANDYKDIPNFFNEVRYKYGGEPAGAVDLRLEVLERYIAEVFERSTGTGTRALQKALPESIGVGIFQFWIDFAAWKRKTVAETATDQD